MGSWKSPAARFRAICLALPETYEKETWDHPTFRVGKDKMFAGMATDGSSASLKADPDERPALLAEPERYFLPAYVGSKGWVGIHLAHPETDWDEVAELVQTSYSLIAPAHLRELLVDREGRAGR